MHPMIPGSTKGSPSSRSPWSLGTGKQPAFTRPPLTLLAGSTHLGHLAGSYLGGTAKAGGQRPQVSMHWLGAGRQEARTVEGKRAVPEMCLPLCGESPGRGLRTRPGFAQQSPSAERKHLLRNSAKLPTPSPAFRDHLGPGPPPASQLTLGSPLFRALQSPSPAISRGCCAQMPAALPGLLKNLHTCVAGRFRPHAGGPKRSAGTGAGEWRGRSWAGAAPLEPAPTGHGVQRPWSPLSLEGQPQGPEHLLSLRNPRSVL